MKSRMWRRTLQRFRRRESPAAVAPSPGARDATPRRRDWAQLPALRPSSHQGVTEVSQVSQFASGIVAGTQPDLALQPLGHEVRPEAPRGIAVGVARAVAPAVQRESGALPLIPGRLRRRNAPSSAPALRWPEHDTQPPPDAAGGRAAPPDPPRQVDGPTGEGLAGGHATEPAIPALATRVLRAATPSSPASPPTAAAQRPPEMPLRLLRAHEPTSHPPAATPVAEESGGPLAPPLSMPLSADRGEVPAEAEPARPPTAAAAGETGAGAAPSEPAPRAQPSLPPARSRVRPTVGRRAEPAASGGAMPGSPATTGRAAPLQRAPGPGAPTPDASGGPPRTPPAGRSAVADGIRRLPGRGTTPRSEIAGASPSPPPPLRPHTGVQREEEPVDVRPTLGQPDASAAGNDSGTSPVPPATPPGAHPPPRRVGLGAPLAKLPATAGAEPPSVRPAPLSRGTGRPAPQRAAAPGPVPAPAGPPVATRRLAPTLQSAREQPGWVAPLVGSQQLQPTAEPASSDDPHASDNAPPRRPTAGAVGPADVTGPTLQRSSAAGVAGGPGPARPMPPGLGHREPPFRTPSAAGPPGAAPSQARASGVAVARTPAQPLPARPVAVAQPPSAAVTAPMAGHAAAANGVTVAARPPALPTAGGAPPVQRRVDVGEMSSSVPDDAPPAAPAAVDPEEMFRKLYPRVRDELRWELLVQRERAGLLSDPM